jgi:glycosyltransferase involved in cell wall biosynthesis
MIAPVYPPSQGPAGAAGLRARAFAAGLRGLGYEVTVLCAMPRGMTPERDEGVEVISVPWLDLEGVAQLVGLEPSAVTQPGAWKGPARHKVLRRIVTTLAVPDRFFTWIPSAYRLARRLSRTSSVVLCTGQRSAYIVGRLAHGSRPWIADLNDLWSDNPQRPVGRIRNRIDAAMESWVLKDVERVVTVNELIAEEWQRRLKRPITSINSGFHLSDFADIERYNNEKPIRLVYSGTVYFTFDLAPLYEAVAGGLQEGWLSEASLRLSFIGRLSERVAYESEERGISQFFDVSGPIDHSTLLRKLVEADALILPVFGTDPYATPMKFFEYVGARRPIVALGPTHLLAARLVVDNRLGVALGDAAAVKEFLRAVVRDRSALPVPDQSAREKFTWDRSVERLASVLKDAVTSR